MRSKLLKWFCVLVFPALFFTVNSKSVEISDKDTRYAERFFREWRLPRTTESLHHHFARQLALIKALQDSVLTYIRHEEIPHTYFGDLAYYYQNKKGFCYDRAVLLEKLLSCYGFSFRHVFIYYGADGRSPSLLDFFRKGTSSHAILEVKTQKGWMAVGSNANWLGLTKEGDVLNLSALRNSVRQESLSLRYTPTIGKVFWEDKGENFRFVYGVYSRHGDFFKGQNNTSLSSLLALPFLPDYNLTMLLENL